MSNNDTAKGLIREKVIGEAKHTQAGKMLSEKGGKSGVVVAIVGMAATLVSLFVVYSMTYHNVGPTNWGWRTVVFVSLITTIVFGVVLIIVGFVLYCSPALSGEELTGFVEAQQKKRQ